MNFCLSNESLCSCYTKVYNFRQTESFVNYCPSGVCGNSTDNARKRCNETCTVNADCNGDDECYDVSDTCYEFKCTKIDEIAETECNKRCNNFDDRMCDDGEECVNCHSCQLPENSPNQTCDESKACWRNSTNISINSCPAEEESCLPVPFPCPFNAPVPVATKSPTMVPSLEPTPEYKPPTIGEFLCNCCAIVLQFLRLSNDLVANSTRDGLRNKIPMPD